MAVTVEWQCAEAQDNEAPQTLAITLAVVFATYAFAAIFLSGVAILTSSHAPEPKGKGDAPLVPRDTVVHAVPVQRT